MKILVIDTAYPAFLESLPPVKGSYSEELSKYMDRGFGTFDAYSHYLKAQGWTSDDVIANCVGLQFFWAREHGYPLPVALTMSSREIVNAQVSYFKPDVIFLQDIGHHEVEQLRRWKSSGYLIGAQCSCALSPSVDVSPIDVIFTSLPTHVEKFKALGVRAEYLPLAFDPRMKPAECERDIDISFCGGVGKESHWRAGTDVLEAVAAEFGERFHWYGYGLENLSADSPLRKCYRGSAFGKEMYSVYARSKCVVTRHGEVSQGFSNNLRMYEATGCGALLFTEKSFNIAELFPKDTCVTYSDPADLCEKLHHFLANDTARAFMAQLGQFHTLSHHTYDLRMKQVSAVLSECLERRQVAQ